MAELYIKDGIGIFDNKAVNADGKQQEMILYLAFMENTVHIQQP